MNYRALAISVASFAVAGAASADVLFDQIGTGASTNGFGYASQNIPDFAPDYNIIAIEDVQVSGSYNLTSIDMIAFFFNTSTPDPANISGYQFAVYSAATGNGGSTDTDNTGDVLNAHFDASAVTVTPDYGSVTGNYLFHLDLTSANLTLNSGQYWFGMSPDLEFGVGGQTAVSGGSLVDSGSAAMNGRQMNGGGGFGLAGNNAMAVNGTTGLGDNFAYRLEGSAVPEPATLAILGFGALAAMKRRKR